MNSSRISSTLRRGHTGFTLIELMIVVAVVAILAAIAYPSYREQIAKSRRADAQRALSEAEQYLRRYFAAKDTYEDAELPNGLTTSPRPGSGEAAYNIVLIEDDAEVDAITEDNATVFIVRAVCTGSMANDRCGDLEITSTGKKTQLNAASSATMADCFKAS